MSQISNKRQKISIRVSNQGSYGWSKGGFDWGSDGNDGFIFKNYLQMQMIQRKNDQQWQEEDCEQRLHEKKKNGTDPLIMYAKYDDDDDDDVARNE